MPAVHSAVPITAAACLLVRGRYCAELLRGRVTRIYGYAGCAFGPEGGSGVVMPSMTSVRMTTPFAVYRVRGVNVLLPTVACNAVVRVNSGVFDGD